MAGGQVGIQAEVPHTREGPHLQAADGGVAGTRQGGTQGGSWVCSLLGVSKSLAQVAALHVTQAKFNADMGQCCNIT